MIVLVDSLLLPDYRQAITEAAIDRLATVMQERLVGDLLINRRPEEPDALYVVDGAVRVAAAKALGIEHLPARVIEVDAAEEARTFTRMNARRPA